MSHFTSIKIELRSLDTLYAALKRQGLLFQVGGVVEDYYHNTQNVDILVQVPGQRPIGFRRDPATGVINLVGDWWGAKISEKEFLENLVRNYAREQVLDSLEQQGIDLSKVREREEADGTVVFEVPLEESDMAMLAAGS